MVDRLLGLLLRIAGDEIQLLYYLLPATTECLHAACRTETGWLRYAASLMYMRAAMFHFYRSSLFLFGPVLLLSRIETFR